jgi:hypothetical protein
MIFAETVSFEWKGQMQRLDHSRAANVRHDRTRSCEDIDSLEAADSCRGLERWCLDRQITRSLIRATELGTAPRDMIAVRGCDHLGLGAW